MEQAISETEDAGKKREPVGSPGAIYLLLSSKGWRGRKGRKQCAEGKRIRGKDGRISAGDVQDHMGGVVSSWMRCGGIAILCKPLHSPEEREPVIAERAPFWHFGTFLLGISVSKEFFRKLNVLLVYAGSKYHHRTLRTSH